MHPPDDCKNNHPDCYAAEDRIRELEQENARLKARLAKVVEKRALAAAKGNIECMGGHDGLGCGPECSAKEE